MTGAQNAYVDGKGVPGNESGKAGMIGHDKPWLPC